MRYDLKNISRRLMVPAVLMTLVACTSSDEVTLADGYSSVPVPEAIGFDAYLHRPTSRSGATGTLTLDGTGSTTSLKTKGFGVLAYSTGHEYYSQLAIPDFMYNDHITYNNGETRWEYSPIKYWPNGEGETQSGVTGNAPHYVSFFAYAPWVKVEEATGLVATGGSGDEYSATNGIVALTRNAKTGDPMVLYNVSFDPAERVDLCWATPKLNQTKPIGTVSDEASKVNMSFHHALTAMNIQIDSDIRQEQNGGTMNAAETRVWVRSVSIQGITTQGLLNLNNPSTTTPLWLQLDGVSTLSTRPATIHDGRRNDYEGVLADVNETTVGLNPRLVQSGPYTITDGAITAPAAAGVTTTTVNLFGDDADGSDRELPVYVIPTAIPLRISIVYDVETYDEKLVSDWLADSKTHGSSICNNISANVPLGTLVAGKLYKINLHLGIASVEATATVTNWPTEGTEAEVEVPE